MGFKTFLVFFVATFGLGVLLFFGEDVKTWLDSRTGLSASDKVSDLLQSLMEAPAVKLDFNEHKASATNKECHHFDCFDVYKCGGHHKKILVHIPKPKRIIHGPAENEVSPYTSDFVDVLEAVVESDYYTSNPDEACVFVPAFNLINEESLANSDVASRSLALTASPHWSDGKNNLLFSFVTGSSDSLKLDHGSAMVAASGLSTFSFRSGLDIALPTYSLLQEKPVRLRAAKFRSHLITASEDRVHSKFASLIKDLKSHDRAAVLRHCHDKDVNDEVRCDAKGNRQDYLSTLSESKFCLITKENHGNGLGTSALMEAMHAGCIPVIVIDSLVLPFSDVVDWKRFSIRFYEHDVSRVLDHLSGISDAKVAEMQEQVLRVYNSYFKDLKTITKTSLDILNDRVFPQHARTYREWNLIGNDFRPPLFFSHTPSEEGFTAVILTYDRIESLYSVIRSVAETPSLSSILVVWNNQNLKPPDLSEFPVVSKPIQIIRTKANVLSNRFYPYEEIKTEAVLSMDDDIVMLTADELEFAYQVWREFPDRLVGFPSRTHVWNNTTGSWRYESEWVNDVSMVLTGAAFYHKYWHYLFTASPNPAAKAIKDWVDSKMNCEDIAMNFMVANATGKAPIKVTPRKKFKCSTPQCTNVDMLSSYQSHMVERSDCINMLVKQYGYMPLKKAEFRADPVLFKDVFPDKLKKFVNIGSL